jgi:hypothetical protein
MITHSGDKNTPEDGRVCCFASAPFVPTLLQHNLRVDATDFSKGGVPPCLLPSIFAATTIVPPAELQLQAEAQRADMQEKYSGPSDVWKDPPVLECMKGSLEMGLLAHETRRVIRRAKAFVYKDEKLYRVFEGGICKEVPAPHKREEIVKQTHEQHGHFGVRRTTALLHPAFYWHGLSTDV